MENGELIVKMALAGWRAQVNRAEQTFNAFAAADFQLQVSPGKNRVIYLYGHLSSYHDALKETLGIGRRHRPDLHAVFLQNPDELQAEMPTVEELREFWDSIHRELESMFSELSVQDWFSRHSAMTDEDFKKDPSRNRLSVL